MNQKIMASLMIAVIVLVSVHLVIVISEKIETDVWDKDSPSIGTWTGTADGVIRGYQMTEFNIETQEDLTKIVDALVFKMYENEIYLSMRDVSFLAGLDMDQIRLPENKMDGFGSGKGTWHDGYSLHGHKKDGTRYHEEFSKNGTLLKSIKIYDEPEKDILILLK